MSEKRAWRVLREDEDYGTGTYEVGLEGDAPPRGDEKLVAAAEVNRGNEEIFRRAAADDRVEALRRRFPFELEDAPGRCLYCADHLADHDIQLVQGRGILILCPVSRTAPKEAP